ncbi:MAG: LysR family transcriptional regulator, partial [Ruminiclostridium sp.]|nr:LysR family transcriptional regulator [Ruminiclostridium sp.]
MGKYLPVIVTAECGSLTRAAQTLGYTQPSLGYIISNLEEELGAKIFFRSQRGMTLTDVGEKMLETMRKIEAMEEELVEQAQAGQGGLLRLGIFPSVAAQWMPAILAAFR